MVWCIGLGCFDLDASGGAFCRGDLVPLGLSTRTEPLSKPSGRGVTGGGMAVCLDLSRRCRAWAGTCLVFCCHFWGKTNDI